MSNKKVGNIISNDRIKEVEQLELYKMEQQRKRLEYEKAKEEKRRHEEYIKNRTKEITEIHQTIQEYLDNPYHKLLEIQFYCIDIKEEFDFTTGREYNKEFEKLVNIYCDTDNIYINEFNEIMLRTKPVGVFLSGMAKETKEIFDMELPLGIITGVQIVELKPQVDKVYINGFLFEYKKDEKVDNNAKVIYHQDYIGDKRKADDLTFFILDRMLDEIKANKTQISEYSSKYNYGFKLLPKLPKEISKEFLEKYSQG